MPGWKSAPVNGVWRLENADYHGHRLTVYRSRAGAYRAYLDGRMPGRNGCNTTSPATQRVRDLVSPRPPQQILVSCSTGNE
jgi:hypothetical protein